MKFTDLFIRRPVLALVVSLLIFLIGLKCLLGLQIRQYPRKKTTLEALAARFGDESESSESKQAEMMMRVIEEFRPLYERMKAVGILDTRQEVLSMPQLKTVW